MPLFTLANNYYRSNRVTLTGDVQIGEQSSLWFDVVIRGDVAPIQIGRRVNVQDGVIIHCDTDVPNIIEDDVSIGHRALVHGKHVGRGSLIGMGAILLGETVVGEECLIGAGAVLSPGTIVPPRSVVVGVPGKVVRSVGEKEISYMKWLTTRYIDLAEQYVRGEVKEHG
jgi:carbonic anhydrase/acetyltransferase-like protein (isoleucine patch superfamily)